jgi:hypothetical protein
MIEPLPNPGVGVGRDVRCAITEVTRPEGNDRADDEGLIRTIPAPDQPRVRRSGSSRSVNGQANRPWAGLRYRGAMGFGMYSARIAPGYERVPSSGGLSGRTR